MLRMLQARSHSAASSTRLQLWTTCATRSLGVLDRGRSTSRSCCWWSAASRSRAIGLLRDLADQQGKSRVQLAGAMAREDLRRIGEDALTQARARRASARRCSGCSREHAAATVGPFLRRSCETATPIALRRVRRRQAASRRPASQLPWERDRRRRAPSRASASWRPADGRQRGARRVGADRRRDRARACTSCACSTQSSRETLTRARRARRPPRQLPHLRDDAGRRLHAPALGGACRTAARRCAHRGAAICTRRAFRCSPRRARPSRCSKRACPPARSTTSAGRLVRRLLVTAVVLAALAVLGGRDPRPAGRAARAARSRKRRSGSATAISRRRSRSAAPPRSASSARTMEDMRATSSS